MHEIYASRGEPRVWVEQEWNVQESEKKAAEEKSST